MRVLLVDDDEHLLISLARMFRAVGRASQNREPIELMAARTIADAEALLVEQHFDAVLADQSLGQAERGLDLLARAAALAPGTCRLLFTGRVLDYDELIEAERIPLDGIIDKPTAPEEFVVQLQRFVEAKRAARH